MNSVLIEVMLENFVHTPIFYYTIFNEILDLESKSIIQKTHGKEACRIALKQLVQELK